MLTENATLNKPRGPTTHEKNSWYFRRLTQEFVDVQAILGERMYAAGIDDGQLCAKIRAVEEQLQRTEGEGLVTQKLKAARCQLVLQLAFAALENDGRLPGAEAEYCRALQAQAALERHENAINGGLTSRLK